MKKVYVLCLLTVLFFINFIGCVSYSIPYDKKLSNNTIEALYFVDEKPRVRTKFSTALRALIHVNSITKTYKSVDVRSMIQNELVKNAGLFKSKMNIITSDEFKDLKLKKKDNYSDLDPKFCEYKFDTIKKSGKNYILTLRVLAYGYKETTFSTYSYISYVAALHDIGSHKKVWQHKDETTHYFPAFSTMSRPKDKVEVTKHLQNCISEMIKGMAVSMMKKQ